jgi:hypothetical protein
MLPSTVDGTLGAWQRKFAESGLIGIVIADRIRTRWLSSAAIRCLQSVTAKASSAASEESLSAAA